MNKSFIILSTMTCMLICGSSVSAQEISERQARSVAAETMVRLRDPQQAAASEFIEARKANPVLAYTSKSGSQTNYYVFNNDDGEGFVIVAGDEKAGSRVLGYCDHGSFNYDDAPDNLKALLAQYSIEMVQLQKEETSKPQAESRKQADAIGNVVVGPLLTTTWNQEEPYFNLTPVLDGVYHVCTGCGPTALAQIMAYWKYPAQGRGQFSYYYNPTIDTRVDYSIDFSKSTYDWDNMLDNYANGYNESQANAVATLMRDAGYAVETRWGYYPEGSSANPHNIEPALINFFDYNADSIRTIQRFQDKSVEDTGAFDEMLKKELDAGRPLMFLATVPWIIWGSTNGHYIIIDGYTDDGYFHMNFGWGGQSDGYYKTVTFAALKNPMVEQLVVMGICPNYSIKVNDSYYYLSGGSAVFCYSEAVGALEVPESIEVDGKTYPVTSLARKALLKNDKITQLTLPPTVTSIGEQAFQECRNLTTVTLPDNIETIGRKAFAWSGITRINLSKMPLTAIADSTFISCESLTNVGLPAHAHSIGDRAFSGCSRLSYISNLELADSIGELAFYQCQELSYVRVNADVIGNMAFALCRNVQNINFGNKVSEIGTDVFDFSALRLISVAADNPCFVSVDNVLYDKDMSTLFLCVPLCYSGLNDNSGKDYGIRMELVIPESVTLIKNGALSRLQAQRSFSLTIPESVISIEPGAFSGFNENVSDIYDYASIPQSIDESGVFPPYLFNRSPGNPLTLHVRKGCREAYSQAAGWSQFENIMEDLPAADDPTADIEAAKVNAVSMEVREFDPMMGWKFSTYVFLFSSLPKISYNYERMVFESGYWEWRSQGWTISNNEMEVTVYPGRITDIQFVYIEDADIRNVEADDDNHRRIRFAMNARSIDVSGLAAGEAIVLCTLDGVQITTARAGADGKACLVLPTGAPGSIYLLKAGNEAFKITARN